MKTDYRQLLSLQAVRMNKADVAGLIQLLEAEFPDKRREDDLELSASVGHASISSNNADKFLDHVDLQRKFVSITLKRIGWSPTGDIDRSVRISFHHNFGQLQVSGLQQAWVIGVIEVIRRYLKSRRPKLWFLQTWWGWAINGAILSGAILAILSGATELLTGNKLLGGLILTSGLFLGSASILLIWKYPFVAIDFREQKPDMLPLPVKIALVALLFSAVSASMAVANYLKQ